MDMLIEEAHQDAQMKSQKKSTPGHTVVNVSKFWGKKEFWKQ